MASSASSNIIFVSVSVVLFFLLCSPFSTPAAQQLPETSKSPVDLKFTTKRLHRISVQLSSLVAQIIDSAADDVARSKKVETIRELLAVISAMESLLNQYFTGMRRRGGVDDGLAVEMVPTLESLKYVISAVDEADSISLPSDVSDEFSNLLKRLLSFISSLELDITALFTAKMLPET